MTHSRGHITRNKKIGAGKSPISISVRYCGCWLHQISRRIGVILRLRDVGLPTFFGKLLKKTLNRLC